LEILQAIAGSREFNPGSLEHLRWVLFDRLGFPVLKRTDKGAPSTDKASMVLLALYAQTKEQIGFLQALVSWRKAAKLSSTWVGIWEGPEWRGEEKITGQNRDGSPKKEILPIEPQPAGQWLKGIPVLNDGRIHPSWSLRTKSGRFSSSPNAQNWTTALKKIFCAEPGNELVGLDLAQAELRGTAYFTGDQDLLRMYQEGINVHTANTTLLFHIRCPNQKDTNEATERFLSEAIPRLIGLRYEDFPVAQAGQWKGQRTLAKNFVFGDIYGAEAKTLYEVIRAKRDPDTDKLLFPNIQLDQIEACKIIWEQTHPAIPRWWKTITREIQGQGFYECPLSGRRRHFKAGFKRNEMLNIPNQSLVASRMNIGTLRIRDQLPYRLPSKHGITMQVHDMLGVECPKGQGAEIAEMMDREFDRPFALPGFPEAVLPTDWRNGEGAKVGTYVDEV
jgi:DNA polymerase-1